MKKPKVKRFLTVRDFVVFSIAVIATLIFHVCYMLHREVGWRVKWGELAKEKFDIIIKDEFIRMRQAKEGALYETCSPASFVAVVESCASNQVNNVWYVGSTNGFDCFIHNSDFKTQRIRVHSCNLKEAYRMPKTDDVTRWLTVSEPPSSAAELTSFLNGGQLMHPPKRPY